MGLLHTTSLKSDQHLKLQTAGHESQALLRSAQKEFGSKLDRLERTQDKLSRLYLNT